MTDKEKKEEIQSEIIDAENDARVAMAFYKQLVSMGMPIDIAIKALVAWIRTDYK